MTKRRIGVVLVLLFTSSCWKAADEEAKLSWQQTKNVTTIGQEGLRDFRVPSLLWDRLMGVASTGVAQQESIFFFPIAVQLVEKTPGVLKKGPVQEIRFGEGGGAIDLSQFLTGQAGSYSVLFRWEGIEPDKGVTDSKVFFYSRAKKRRVNGEIFGSGCQTVLDLSKAVGVHGGPLTVNSARLFDRTVLGGHFIFRWLRDGTSRVTRVTIRDSQNQELFCDSEH